MASEAPQDRARTIYGRLIEQARLTLGWERLWPRLAPALGVLALFVTLAWFGLFQSIPFWARLGLLGLFGIALLAALALLVGLRIPTMADALGRIDTASGVPHRPATALGDRMAVGPSDPISRALWAAHQRDVEAKTRAIRLGPPRPGLPAVDRFALRIALLLGLATAFLYAGPERGSRLLAAFDAPVDVTATPSVRVDAWVTPPGYTRRPPVLLSAERTGGPITVPQGSGLVVRVAGDASAEIVPTGAFVEAEAPQSSAPRSGGAALAAVVERRLTLAGDSSVTVRRGGADVAGFRFSIIPDKPPTIALDGPIKSAARGAMTLTYKIEDDYGATSAEALVALPGGTSARPLFDPPKISLALPSGRARSGVASATRDVSEHPFAGGAVAMTLVARDDAGNEGRSATETVTLPGRMFVKPVARALVEQRRKLASDANKAPLVKEALDALAVAPEIFTKDLSIYLGLRVAYVRLDNARDDDALRNVVEYLWQMALRIEEGDLSEAERELKAAQERLREALERGATPEEIEKLTKELREAMNKFLQEYAERLAQQGRNNQDQSLRNQQSPDRMVTPEDLNAMLDRMQEMARNGAKDQAQQLLSELNDILENLQSSEQGEMAEDPAMRELQRSLDELSEMIQRQQRLRDQTFREGDPQNGDQGGEQQQGQQEGQGEQQGEQDQAGREGGDQPGGMEGLRQRQEALRRQLEAMRKRLDEMGAPGGEELGQADQAMKDAEGQLGQKNGQGAVGSQGKALEALRRGAQGMAQAMQQAQDGQQGPGQGRPGRGQRTGRGTGNGDDRDPLGRPTRSRGYSDGTVKVPGRGETDVERAARVLEELRRRFSDPLRPQLELDYLERLLRRE
jgi:uncharacterized protein (TIGR02302 family)